MKPLAKDGQMKKVTFEDKKNGDGNQMKQMKKTGKEEEEEEWEDEAEDDGEEWEDEDGEDDDGWEDEDDDENTMKKMPKKGKADGIMKKPGGKAGEQQEIEYDREGAQRMRLADGVQMKRYDENGFPMDGYNYYQHIVVRPSASDGLMIACRMRMGQNLSHWLCSRDSLKKLLLCKLNQISISNRRT